MPATPLRALILEDSSPDAELVMREVQRAGFAPRWRRAETEDEYLAELNPELDLILADFSLPQFSALDALQILKARALDVPFIVVSGAMSEEAAVECMQQGATDYLLKDRLSRLGSAIHRALEQKQLREEARRAEEERRLRMLSEEAARAKDEAVSVVSHELRTPLAALVGFAELLLTRDYPEAERRQFLTVMVQEGRRLTALINDFLDLQRMESGRQALTLGPLDPRVVVERAVASVGDDADRPIVLEFPLLLPPVLADADRIQQVLGNLLSNARKYSPHGGPIHLSARRVEGTLEFEIRDRGLGIPADALPRLFEKFYRVDNSDRRAIKGTGLGRAICRKIVEGHGGRVWAESDGLGQGTTVRFTLTIAEQRASGGTVLVVEDNAGFAKLLEAELLARGHSSVWVSSAEAALKHLETARVDAMLLDLVLPGLPGEHVLRHLRESCGPDVQVVVVTVRGPNAALEQALAALRVTTVLHKGPGVAAAAARAIADALDSGWSAAEALAASPE